MIEDQGIILMERFIDATRGLPHYPKALFPSELFMFYREARRVEADHIIESGIGYGGSTAYLDRLFPDIKITSIDRGKVESIRESHPRIQFIQGDGYWEIPEAVRSSKGKNIAILIDGPKGHRAIHLADRILGSGRVRIVAIHDLQVEKNHPEYLKRKPWLRDAIVRFLEKACADSHNQSFRDFAGFLDKDIEAIKKYPNGPGLSIYQC